MGTGRRISLFTRDALTFDVTDTGPLDGDPVVLLHGFPQTSTSWARVTPLLNAEGFRTLAPDLRGYSPRARPRGRRSYRTGELVEDVTALLRLVGAPVHLVGHDWGAMLSWGTAIAHPDLVRTHTSVSVPHPAAFVRSMTSSPQLLHSWYMGFFQLPYVPELALTRFPSVLHRALASKRKELNSLVSQYAGIKGVLHSHVHADLRRECGGPKLAQASQAEVEQRVRTIRSWLKG